MCLNCMQMWMPCCSIYEFVPVYFQCAKMRLYRLVRLCPTTLRYVFCRGCRSINLFYSLIFIFGGVFFFNLSPLEKNGKYNKIKMKEIPRKPKYGRSIEQRKFLLFRWLRSNDTKPCTLYSSMIHTCMRIYSHKGHRCKLHSYKRKV